MTPYSEILFVDDDSFNLLLAARIVKKMGLESIVHFAENGEEAIQWWKKRGKKNLPPLMLLDLNMPVLSGLEMLHSFEREGVDLSETKIVLMLSTEVQEDLKSHDLYKYIKGTIERPLSESKIKAVLLDKE
jgi:CheY-like chemotaxis protein